MEPNQLNQLLQFLLDSLQQTKDFTIEQAPLIIQELLLWKFYSSMIYAAVWSAIGILIGTLGKQFMAGLMQEGRSDEITIVNTGRLIRLIGIFVVLVAISVNGYTMLQVKVAPRVVLMEAVKGFISGR